MDDYLHLNYKVPLRIVGKGSASEPNYYLPPRVVINENSNTTRLRVVFDDSCKSDTGRSLNNVLLKSL